METDNLNTCAVRLPDRQATITKFPYTNALGFHEAGEAWLKLLKPDLVDSMEIRDGSLYFKGSMDIIPETEIRNGFVSRYSDDIDLPMLRVFYSAILQEYQKREFKDFETRLVFQVSDLLHVTGRKTDLSQTQIQALIANINKFKNLLGVISVPMGKRTKYKYYSMLNFEYYDQTNNTFSFSSPYLEYVVKEVCKNAALINNMSEKEVKKLGRPEATHSYLIKSEIAKERNYTAVENVNIIVTLIEQAGNNTPHIKAETLIERNPYFKQAFEESMPQNKQRILDRAFSKTWELMRTMTTIEENYPGIALPLADGVDGCPKVRELRTYVFSFPHNGKRNTGKETS